MVNFFVYHASDGVGHCLATVIRDCDGASGQFEFLAVESGDSVRRMHRFLSQQGLNPRDVALPFIVLLDESAQRRSVLQGRLVHEWLANLVDAYLRATGTTPATVRERVLGQHVPPYFLSLCAFGLAAAAAGIGNAEPHGGQPTEDGRIAVVDADIDDAEEDDDVPGDGALTTYATVPAKRGSGPTGGGAGPTATALMLDAVKKRESMVALRGPPPPASGRRQ